MDYILPEEQLIEYAKPYLKAKGFKKKNKRWTKETEWSPYTPIQQVADTPVP